MRKSETVRRKISLHVNIKKVVVAIILGMFFLLGYFCTTEVLIQNWNEEQWRMVEEIAYEAYYHQEFPKEIPDELKMTIKRNEIVVEHEGGIETYTIREGEVVKQKHMILEQVAAVLLGLYLSCIVWIIIIVLAIIIG